MKSWSARKTNSLLVKEYILLSGRVGHCYRDGINGLYNVELFLVGVYLMALLLLRTGITVTSGLLDDYDFNIFCACSKCFATALRICQRNELKNV